MPHYYFNLTDGVTRRDHSGLDCTDDSAAIVKATTIAEEVTAADGDNVILTFTFRSCMKTDTKCLVFLSG
jgi:hypothetical protein